MILLNTVNRYYLIHRVLLYSKLASCKSIFCLTTVRVSLMYAYVVASAEGFCPGSTMMFFSTTYMNANISSSVLGEVEKSFSVSTTISKVSDSVWVRRNY